MTFKKFSIQQSNLVIKGRGSLKKKKKRKKNLVINLTEECYVEYIKDYKTKQLK